ncbi:MAG TPA: bifunctional DNA-formamidopyrimidine glycosylase/DNA-(apurinic or apyrimidinic site) lyase [bacterium]
MPELPEVETIVRGLREQVLGHEITSARLLKTDMLRSPRRASRKFNDFFRGRKFVEIDRIGKFMLFTLNDGSHLVAHLGMTGKFVVTNGRRPDPRYLCSQYTFQSGQRLDHIDVRRFGRLEIHAPGSKIPIIERLGPDPLSPGFSAQALRPLLFGLSGRRRQRAMHTLLLDQSLISGVGNIYASEALFRAGIRPQRRADRVQLKELGVLADSLRQVMEEAVAAGGTTVNDYRRVDDKPGDFVDMLNVYDREGEPCHRCKAQIKRIRLGGRSAYYCPKCQL